MYSTIYTHRIQDFLNKRLRRHLCWELMLFTTETEPPFEVTGAACFRNQAQFSPMEFVKYIALKLEISGAYEGNSYQRQSVNNRKRRVFGRKDYNGYSLPDSNVPGFILCVSTGKKLFWNLQVMIKQ